MNQENIKINELKQLSIDLFGNNWIISKGVDMGE